MGRRSVSGAELEALFAVRALIKISACKSPSTISPAPTASSSATAAGSEHDNQNACRARRVHHPFGLTCNPSSTLLFSKIKSSSFPHPGKTLVPVLGLQLRPAMRAFIKTAPSAKPQRQHAEPCRAEPADFQNGRHQDQREAEIAHHGKQLSASFYSPSKQLLSISRSSSVLPAVLFSRRKIHGQRLGDCLSAIVSFRRTVIFHWSKGSAIARPTASKPAASSSARAAAFWVSRPKM